MKNKLYIDEINIENYHKELAVEYKSDKKLEILEVCEATILPFHNFNNDLNHLSGGVINAQGEYIEESALRRYGTWNYIHGAYDFDNNETKFIDKEVCYLGMQFSHWGHFLLESTTRLWYFINSKHKNNMFFAYYGSKLEGNYLEFFNLLGIKEEQLLYISEPTKFSKIIIPEVSSELTSFWTDEFKQTFEQVSHKVKSEHYEKIYFTRRKYFTPNKLSGIDCRGEKLLEATFSKAGYKVFSPEHLTLRKQIALMKGCKNFASLNSSSSHNLIFSNSSCKAFLINKCNIINKTQILINQMKDIESVYIDANKNLLPVSQGMGPFLLYLSDNFKRFCKDYKLKYKSSELKNKDYLWFFSYWGKVHSDSWILDHVQNPTFEECIKLLNYHLPFKSNNIKKNSLKYKILSNITIGEKRKIYKQKLQELNHKKGA